MPDLLPSIEQPGGLLIVVSGPSAVGKDTVLDALMATPGLPFPVRKCVTATTRAPRPKEGGREEDGVDYHFVSPARFHEMVASDELLEYAEVHSEGWYGTPRRWVDDRRAEGIDVILKIDVQGGRSVKSQSPDAVLIFLQPPTFAELERRLRCRRTESEDRIAVRLLNARSEMAQRRHYDYAVTNDTVPETVNAIKSILLAEHYRIRKHSG
ncbi:MAG: guanylate kinase [Capsulimonadaceae bacterium]